MPYVLQRFADHQYVKRPGSGESYTPHLEDARLYPTREMADRDRCKDNERILSLADILGENS